MKKCAIIITVIMIILALFYIGNVSYASENGKAIDDQTESKIVEMKDNTKNSIEDYKEKYGSDMYGTVAFVLNIVRIYSIPLGFLGIVIGVIHKYMIGVRKLDTLEKGISVIVISVTLLIICQILPLAFAVFVKFGRG